MYFWTDRAKPSGRYERAVSTSASLSRGTLVVRNRKARGCCLARAKIAPSRAWAAADEILDPVSRG